MKNVIIKICISEPQCRTLAFENFIEKTYMLGEPINNSSRPWVSGLKRREPQAGVKYWFLGHWRVTNARPGVTRQSGRPFWCHIPFFLSLSSVCPLNQIWGFFCGCIVYCHRHSFTNCSSSLTCVVIRKKCSRCPCTDESGILFAYFIPAYS